jgi:predicted transcriptional regulator
MLAIAEATCRYAAAQLGNGIGPAEARAAALFTAGELELVAGALRRLTRLDGPQRRALAVKLHALGIGTRQIAATVGVSERSVRYYLAGRPAALQRAVAGPSSCLDGSPLGVNT